MYSVEISGWHKGFNKVAHTITLQEFCDSGLGDAKAKTDAVLDGHLVVISVESRAKAEELVIRLHDIGAVVAIKPA